MDCRPGRISDNSLRRCAVDDPLVSIIVPVYNEEDALDFFLESVNAVLEQHACRYEFVFINDGSTDKTLGKLLETASLDDRIRIINFSRNFGKEAALTAGIDYAEGESVIVMDVDLQDPPWLIIEFLKKWQEGYDIVYGLRQGRENDTFLKKFTAACFYKVIKGLSHTSIPENVGDFRLIDRRVVNALRQLPERNRFMKGLFSWVGFQSVAVPFHRPQRLEGKTKWNYWKLWNFAIDGFASFTTAPLRIWTYIGIGVSIMAFLYASFIVLDVVINGIDAPGYASLITIVLFLGGLQLLSLGILGEYIGRLFLEVKSRPIYLVEGVYENHEYTPH